MVAPSHGGKRPGAGRPKGARNRVTADIKALAQTYGADAIDTLAEIMKNESAPEAARISAAKELIDRGFGKAVQATEISGKDGSPLSFAPPVIQILAYDDQADPADEAPA
jgi:hypothetical protein